MHQKQELNKTLITLDKRMFLIKKIEHRAATLPAYLSYTWLSCLPSLRALQRLETKTQHFIVAQWTTPQVRECSLPWHFFFFVSVRQKQTLTTNYETTVGLPDIDTHIYLFLLLVGKKIAWTDKKKTRGVEEPEARQWVVVVCLESATICDLFSFRAKGRKK